MLVTLTLAATAFASTNIDDFVLLVAFLAMPAYRAREVVAGQFLGIFTLVAASLALSLLAMALPPRSVGLLGVLPVALGLHRLWAGGEAEAEAVTARGGAARRVLTVAAVTVSDGGDNLSVWTPLFASATRAETSLTIAVFAALTALWCAVAGVVARQAARLRRVRVAVARALPWVWIAIGAYIISGTLVR